jgi:hypothetical protein
VLRETAVMERVTTSDKMRWRTSDGLDDTFVSPWQDLVVMWCEPPMGKIPSLRQLSTKITFKSTLTRHVREF